MAGIGKCILNKTISKRHLPNEASFYSVEAYAIDLALNLITESTHQNFIFSDSLSVLKSLKTKKKQQKTSTTNLLNRPTQHIKKKLLCLIPSHTDIKGSDKVDSV